jgi:hypothetical protein
MISILVCTPVTKAPDGLWRGAKKEVFEEEFGAGLV